MLLSITKSFDIFIPFVFQFFKKPLSSIIKLKRSRWRHFSEKIWNKFNIFSGRGAKSRKKGKKGDRSEFSFYQACPCEMALPISPWGDHFISLKTRSPWRSPLCLDSISNQLVGAKKRLKPYKTQEKTHKNPKKRIETVLIRVAPSPEEFKEFPGPRSSESLFGIPEGVLIRFRISRGCNPRSLDFRDGVPRAKRSGVPMFGDAFYEALRSPAFRDTVERSKTTGDG
jgi:hypothetical protein